MYVVADFAAGPVQYGSARDGDGAVPPQMPVWSGGYSDLARLVKAVDGALAHVFAPDVYGQLSVRSGKWAVGRLVLDVLFCVVCVGDLRFLFSG